MVPVDTYNWLDELSSIDFFTQRCEKKYRHEQPAVLDFSLSCFRILKFYITPLLKCTQIAMSYIINLISKNRFGQLES